MDQIRFDGQVAIVTGSNSEIGVGFYYAKLLAERGAKVMLHGRSEAKVQKAAQALLDMGYDVDYAVADVSKEAELSAMVKKTVDKWGRIDILINNAGGADGEYWPDVTPENLVDYFRLNTVSSIVLMREVWPYMKAQKYGRIINTSSNSTFGGYQNTGYPVSKSALVGLVRFTALLGAADNILINGIYPAAFTQLTGQLPPGQFADVLKKDFVSEKVAPLVAYLCSKENTDYTGEMYSVGGGKFTLVKQMTTEAAAYETLEDVDEQMKKLHAPDQSFVPTGTAFEDTIRLGMPPEAIAALFGNV